MNGDGDRSAPRDRNEPPLRLVELWELTVAPEYDEDVKEWKVVGIPVRSIWGSVSGSGEWMGGGHRGEEGVERRWRKEADERISTLWLPDWWREPDDVPATEQHALKAPPPLWVGERVYATWIDGYRCLFPSYKAKAVGFCLAEDHPGKGTEFDVYAGIWNIADQEWEYECTTDNKFKCIDWRYGVPYPDEGATGLGQWNESTDNGAILEPLPLDCESPGPCCE